MRFVLIVACALLAAGCAIRPLPEQVTGVTTYHIVKQIRCETREAVFNVFIEALTRNAESFGESAREAAEGFHGHPELMNKFKPALFAGRAKKFVDYFWNTGIAYNFNLDMTEVDNFDAQIDFIQPLGRQTRTLALGGGLDRQRENTRTFTITDDFKGLLNLAPEYCDGHVVLAQNHIYPIVGNIGIQLFINEFVRIALFTNLKEDKDSGAPTMVDTLKFQTVVSGAATPKVVFSPIGRGFQLADASLIAQASPYADDGFVHPSRPRHVRSHRANGATWRPFRSRADIAGRRKQAVSGERSRSGDIQAIFEQSCRRQSIRQRGGLSWPRLRAIGKEQRKRQRKRSRRHQRKRQKSNERNHPSLTKKARSILEMAASAKSTVRQAEQVC